MRKNLSALIAESSTNGINSLFASEAIQRSYLSCGKNSKTDIATDPPNVSKPSPTCTSTKQSGRSLKFPSRRASMTFITFDIYGLTSGIPYLHDRSSTGKAGTPNLTVAFATELLLTTIEYVPALSSVALSKGRRGQTGHEFRAKESHHTTRSGHRCLEAGVRNWRRSQDLACGCALAVVMRGVTVVNVNAPCTAVHRDVEGIRHGAIVRDRSW